MDPISGRPKGMPMAKSNVPAIFSMNLYGAFLHLVNLVNSCDILVTLSSGSCIVLMVPSNIHPKISFLIAQIQSPFIIFLYEIDSSPL